MVPQSPARSSRSRTSPTRHNKRPRQTDTHASDVYQEMLDEAEARYPEQFATGRPTKRRRVGDMKAVPVGVGPSEPIHPDPEADKHGTQPVQTIYDSSTSEESEAEWEDVEFQQSPQSLLKAPTAFEGDDQMLQITLEQEPEQRKKAVQRRKPLTGAERKARLDVHKAHVLCLLGHVQLRNMWCNDEILQVRSGSLGILVMYLTAR